ncbi:MAG TPA: ATP-binding protein [Ktedonobacterales bacterium]|nr:ATP-binding protein [Ktedonobacterales bacterium]
MVGLQVVLATFAIFLSVFSLITYLWLGLTVLLLGNRRARVTWEGGLGLLIAAVFFLCHGALVGAGVAPSGTPADFWWRLSWLPAFAAPLFWAAIGLHYIIKAGPWGRLRRAALGGVAALALLAAILTAVNWRAIASYGDFLRLIMVALGVRGAPSPRDTALASPALPALAIAFVAYMGACATLPWAALAARRWLPQSAPASFAPGASGVHEPAQLWDSVSAWNQSRRALLGASLCMVVAGVVVGLVGVLTFIATRLAHYRPAGGLPARVAATPLGHLPIALVTADLVVQLALAVLVLMVGWAVVRQGVLVERRLPQRGFLDHWRGTVAVALVVAAVVAWLAFLDAESLPALLLLVTLMATAYALFSWRSYAAHDQFLEQLRPFVVSLTRGSGGWLATEPQVIEQAVEGLFISLCRDVLGASRGRLLLSAGHLRRTISYVAPPSEGAAVREGPDWVLPVADERGVVARLSLGPRVDGAGYTSTDLEIARACGQRILDAVGEFTTSRTIAQLARRRGLEAELTAVLPRRTLHDDVLPRLHLVMLRLEALRGRLALATQAAPERLAVGAATTTESPAESAADPAGERAIAATLGEVVGELGSVHHDLAALLRATPTAAPRRPEGGYCAALRAALARELAGAFDTLAVDIPAVAGQAADALPGTVADLLLGATLEALRNASRHARGNDLHRQLGVRVTVAADTRWVMVTVRDDGVGLPDTTAPDRPDAPLALPIERAVDGGEVSAGVAGGSTRSGLLTHGALLNLIGGSLAVHGQPDGGTAVTLRVPRTLDAPEP